MCKHVKMNVPSFFNRFLTGLIAGVLLPMLAVFVFYRVSMGYRSFQEFLDLAIRFHAFTKIVSLCVLPNLGLFFVFVWMNLLQAARGVLLATMVVGLGVFIVKLL